MRRHASSRIFGLVLALWFALVGGERAALELCPMHGNMALYTAALGAPSGHMAGHAGHEMPAGMTHDGAAFDMGDASHMHHGDAPPPGHHEGCTCGSGCTPGLTAAVVPEAPALVVATHVRVVAPPASRPASVGPRAPPAYALPFPTGPPRRA